MRIWRSFLLAILVVFVTAGSGLAGEADPQVVAEIKSMLQSYTKAIGDKDLEAVMASFAPGPETVLMGTGPGERWVGSAEIEEAHRRFFENFDKEKFEVTWASVGSDGNVAWLTAMLQITDYLKNEKNEYALNWSATLVKQEGKWYFVSSHFSNLTHR